MGFGSSIFTSGNVTVTEGELLSDVFIGTFPTSYGLGTYSITLNDNTPSKLSIANDFSYNVNNYSGMGYELSNLLGITPKIYARLKIRIQNPSELSGINLDATVNQFDLQQYYYTTAATDDQVNYSPVNVGSGLNEPLPVELTTFTAAYSNQSVELNWQTATEVNNFGFDIEKKIDGGDWIKIGFVAGNGNSNSPNQYIFSDEALFGGSQFKYRLKQMDNDGQFEYSDAVEVLVVPDNFELSQNFPNPFNPSTKFRFSVPVTTNLQFNIYNMLGEHIITAAEGEYAPGFYEAEFNAASLPSGVYIYRIESAEFVHTRKMMLLK